MNNYVGLRFGNYHLIRLLGSGSFGDVYFGEDCRNGTEVAVKILGTRLTGKHEVERFINEAHSVSLQHPNIVKVLDFGIEKGIPFLALEYAPNGTLRQRYPKGTSYHWILLSAIFSRLRQLYSMLMTNNLCTLILNQTTSYSIGIIQSCSVTLERPPLFEVPIPKSTANSRHYSLYGT